MRRTKELAAVLAAAALVTGLARAAGDEPRRLGAYGAECRLAFSPDGAKVAVTTRGGSAALVDVESGRLLTRFRGDAEESEAAVAFSADGERVALGTLEGTVRVFAARSGQEQLTLHAQGPVTSLAFSADGKGVVTGGGRAVNPETDEPDPASPTARVFDAANGAQVLAVDPESGNTFSAVAASPTGPHVAVARADGKLVLLNLNEKKRHTVELGAPSRAVAFSKDGALVAALGGKDGAGATLVDVKAGQVARTLPPGNDPASPDGALAFSPDGVHLARLPAGSSRVLLHDVESGKIVRALDLPGAGVALAYSPDGKTLAVSLRSGEVFLFANPLAK